MKDVYSTASPIFKYSFGIKQKKSFCSWYLKAARNVGFYEVIHGLKISDPLGPHFNPNLSAFIICTIETKAVACTEQKESFYNGEEDFFVANEENC